MELKNVSRYIAGPGRVFMTVLIVLIVVTVVQGFTIEAIRMFGQTRRTPVIKSEPRTAEEKRIERISRSSKQSLPDGTIHLIHVQRAERGPIVEPRNEQIYDVNDKLLWEGPSDQRPYEYLSWAEQPRRYSHALTLMQIKQMQMLTPIFSRTIEIPVGSLNNTEQIWRYCPGAECFEGYNVDGGRIGYIGAAGFADSTSRAGALGQCRLFVAWCPPDSFTPILLWQTDRCVYQIEIEKRQAELLFEAGDSDIETLDLHAWRDFKAGTKGYVDTEKYRPLLVCITEDGVHHLILREPDQRLSIPGPRSFLTATRQGIFAHRVGSDAMAAPAIGASPAQREEWLEQYRNKPRNMWIEFYKVSDDGSLELLNRYDWTVPPIGHFTEEPMLAAQRLVSHFSPPLYHLLFHVLGSEFWAKAYQTGNQGHFFYSMVTVPLWFRPLNSPVNWVLSAMMIGFVFWHGWSRRTSIARFAFWLVFVGLLNLTGLLTYLALNHTAVITCPACGARRGLARADCVRCRAPLPAPKRRPLDLIYDL